MYGEGEIGPVGASLIPSLDSCSDGVEDDCEVESLGVSPSVGHLVAQGLAVLFIKLDNAVDAWGILSDQCTLLEQGEDVGQVGLGGEGLDVLEELLFGNAGKRVLDSAWVSTGRCAECY